MFLRHKIIYLIIGVFAIVSSGGLVFVFHGNFKQVSKTELVLSAKAAGPLVCGTDTVTDSYDGKVYNTVHIGSQFGSQCWLKENLNKGTMIGIKEADNVTLQNQSNDGIVEKYCYGYVKEGDPGQMAVGTGNCDTYGGFYQWSEALQLPSSCNTTDCSASITFPTQGICPSGWHIPKQSEFDVLKNYLINFYSDPLAEMRLAVGGGTGFDALWSGSMSFGNFFDIYVLGENDGDTHFWSTDQINTTDAFNKYYFENGIGTPDSDKKTDGNSVRCVISSPDKVTGLLANPSDSKIILSWNAPSDGGSPITNYNVYRSTASGAEILLAAGGCSSLGNVLSCTDTGLVNGTTYYYKVSAVNAIGEGFQSDEVNTAPVAFVPVAANVMGFAWSENIGWVSFNSKNCDLNNNGIYEGAGEGGSGAPEGCPTSGSVFGYGVNLDLNSASPTFRELSGFAWSENIGWVSFNWGASGIIEDTFPLTKCPSGDDDALCQPKLTGVNFSGWARACSVFNTGCSGALKTPSERGGWDGWISLRNANFTGTVPTVTTIDQAGAVGNDVGRWTSMQLDSAGNPIIAYYDLTNFDLKLIHCNDKFCLGNDEVVSVLDNNVGNNPHTNYNIVYTSMELNSSGNPVIAYYDVRTGDINLIRCANTNCSSFTKQRIYDGGGNISNSDISLKLDSQNHPVISYSDDNFGGDLRIIRCNTEDCSDAVLNPVTIIGGNASIYTSSLALNFILDPVEGIPVISYRQNEFFKVVVCNNANCTNSQINIIETTNPYDAVNDWSRQSSYSSLALDSSGNPVVAYEIKKQIKLAHCNDNYCFGGDESIQTVASIGLYNGSMLRMKLDSAGFPVISYIYYTISGSELRLASCNDIDCIGSDEKITSMDNMSVTTGGYSSLALDSSDYPAVSHFQWSDLDGSFTYDLRLARCSGSDCGRVTAYGVSLAGPDFIDWAWGDDNIGWLSFNCLSTGVCATKNYKVYLTGPVNNPPVASAPTTNAASIDYCTDSFMGINLSWTFADNEDGANQTAYKVKITRNSDSVVYNSGIVSSNNPLVSGSYISGDIPAHFSNANPLGFLRYGTETYSWEVTVYDSFGANSATIPGPNFSFPKHEYPDVDFTPPSPSNFIINDTTNFTDISTCYGSGIPCLAFAWDFCGGITAPALQAQGNCANANRTASGLTASHVYDIAGTYYIVHTVTDSDGYSCSNPGNTRMFGVVRPKWKEVVPR